VNWKMFLQKTVYFLPVLLSVCHGATFIREV